MIFLEPSPLDLASHPALLLAIACSAFVILRLVINFFRRSPKDISHIPGPWYTKYTTIVYNYAFLRGNASSYVDSIHAKYGPIVRIGPSDIAVVDLPAVKRIHTVKHDFVKSPFYEKLQPDGDHNSFSVVNVQQHRDKRKLLSNGMSESSLKKHLLTVDSRVKQTISRMAEEMSKRGAVDVFKWWFFMTTDVIGELSFGESFRMLDLGRKNQYITDLESIGALTAILSAFPFLVRLASAGIPIPFISSTVAIQNRVDGYATESIERYKRSALAEPHSVQQTVFTKLLTSKDSGHDTMDNKAIMREATGYIVAGTDTTSNTLTYLTWAVARDAQIKTSLLAELATLPEDFTDDDLRPLPFLNMVIEETLRLYPAAPSMLFRVAPEGGVTFAGHFIPAGVNVGTQAWSLHRLADVYPEPLRFNPWRWEKEKVTQAMKDAFMPFGGGARVCLGLHLARIELRLGAARFFKTFPRARASVKEGMCDADMRPLEFFLAKPRGERCLIEV